MTLALPFERSQKVRPVFQAGNKTGEILVRGLPPAPQPKLVIEMIFLRKDGRVCGFYEQSVLQVENY